MTALSGMEESHSAEISSTSLCGSSGMFVPVTSTSLPSWETSLDHERGPDWPRAQRGTEDAMVTCMTHICEHIGDFGSLVVREDKGDARV